jgi:hypothetical protein
MNKMRIARTRMNKCYLFGFSKAGFSDGNLSLIPDPVSVVRNSGYYSLSHYLNTHTNSSYPQVDSAAQIFPDRKTEINFFNLNLN